MANGKPVSLKENFEFLRVYKRGKSYGGKFVVLYVMKRKDQRLRLGITVTKKVGKACIRNRARRLIFENMRLFMCQCPRGVDIVVVARPSMVGADFWTVKRELEGLIKRADLVQL